jgi:hypothetical protein
MQWWRRITLKFISCWRWRGTHPAILAAGGGKALFAGIYRDWITPHNRLLDKGIILNKEFHNFIS